MAQTMLIIDDDMAVLASCQRIFVQEGFEVTTATNPLDGLAMAKTRIYTVILCDWQMPELDGMNVVSQLQTHAPESAVVMISGYPSVDRATEAMKRGVMDYLPKPFTPEEILTAVTKAISAKLLQEKKTLGLFEKFMEKFPTPSLDDKGPKIIAETVAQTVGVAKATSPWLSSTKPCLCTNFASGGTPVSNKMPFLFREMKSIISWHSSGVSSSG